MLLHAELFVASMERSLAFYVAGLGLTVVGDQCLEGDAAERMSEGRHAALRWVLLKAAPVGLKVALLQPLAPAPAAGGAGLALPPAHRGTLTLLVTDLEARMAELAARGVSPASAIFPIDLPRTGRSAIVFYIDPDGHAIELLEARKPI